MSTLHHSLRWDGRLVESQEGLETKVGPRADLVGEAGTRFRWPRFRDPDFVRGAPLLHYMFFEVWGVEAELMCLYSLRLPSCTRNPHVVPRGTHMRYSVAVDLVAGLGASQVVSENLGSILGLKHWESTLVEEPSRTTSSSSSSYSLRGIVPEREPIPVIDLSDDELETLIEEDPSEPTSDSEMMPEPQRVAPAATGDMGTFVADSLPIAASPTPILPVESVYSSPALPSILWGGVREHDICGYCLWREQRVEATGQKIMELREEIARVDALFYTACQAHRQATARVVMLEAELGQAREAHAAREREILELIDERDWLRQFIAQFPGTTRDSVDRARDELESRPGCSGSQCPQGE
ncbi:hypothetical protein M9H77_06463 [Catharanthus roseus]|uniref:Uncharacterized protein n=1 Tax=Catharanthus roseus TaxID=4058 RepID=A0ACC0BSD7_CATRO|nr:hypothetical protein M9H77_06463 [Catharanthus roseus]